MISAIMLGVPLGLWLFLGLVVIVVGILVMYALYSKGDVKAVFSHGTTIFTLEAKGRQSKH
jgi:hypothetical protein